MYTSKNDSDICSCRLGDNGLLKQATLRHSYPPWKASLSVNGKEQDHQHSGFLELKCTSLSHFSNIKELFKLKIKEKKALIYNTQAFFLITEQFPYNESEQSEVNYVRPLSVIILIILRYIVVYNTVEIEVIRLFRMKE